MWECTCMSVFRETGETREEQDEKFTRSEARWSLLSKLAKRASELGQKKGNEWHWNSDDKMQEWLLFASGIWWWCLLTMTMVPQNSFHASKFIWIVFAQWLALHSLLSNVLVTIFPPPPPFSFLQIKLPLSCTNSAFFSVVWLNSLK